MKSETWNPPACRFWFSSRWAGALFEQDASEVEILKVGIHLRIHPTMFLVYMHLTLYTLWTRCQKHVEEVSEVSQENLRFPKTFCEPTLSYSFKSAPCSSRVFKFHHQMSVLNSWFNVEFVDFTLTKVLKVCTVNQI